MLAARLLSLLQAVCALGAAWFVFCFIAIALLSIHYPYQLEWMEGQSIDVIARIIEGKSLYVEPSIEYVPFIYPPLYYYVSAVFAQFFGVDFTAARFVSLVSILGVGGIVFAWLRKEGADKQTALIAVGLFYATYELSARWFDVGRIDSLYIFLVLAGVYVFVHYHSARASVLSGMLFTAAFYTKQNTLIILIPLMLVGICQMRRHTLITATVFLASSLVIFVIYNYRTEGWLYFYLFALPASHRTDTNFILGFWRDDLLANLWPLMLLCFVGWVHIFKTDKRKAMLYLAIAAGAAGAAYAGRLHRYGWTNVLIPAHLILALCSALILAWWQQQHKPIRHMLGLSLVLVQMVMLLYNPVYNIPDSDALAQGDEFLKRVAQISGDVFMPEIQFVQTRVGKKSYSYGVAAVDIYQSDVKYRSYVKGKLRREIAEAIQNQRFSAIVTSRLIGLPHRDEFYAGAESISYPQKFVSGYVSKRPFSIMLPINKSGLFNDQGNRIN